MTPIEQKIEGIVDSILADYLQGRDIDRIEPFRHPDKDVIIDIIDKLRRIVFPGYFLDKTYRIYNAKHNLSMLMEDVMFNLNQQIALVLQDSQRSEEICLEFFRSIPKVRTLVQTDLEAAFEGDPAACGKEEIVFSYPGLFAIMVFRLAHELQILGVPMIPRIMTEYAHSVTGIDIHPGATIGEHFFIDHGTGIVVGETTVIGNYVKLYQGVTLGAKSFDADENGNPIKGIKRHPQIGNGVVIYAGATILGGDTIIGDDCIIGSNVWLTKSVEPHSFVYYNASISVCKH